MKYNSKSMKYVLTSHRFAQNIFDTDANIKKLWEELISVLDSITDEDLINKHNEILATQPETKSLSKAINALIKERLVPLGWNAESPIFADPDYDDSKGTWRLDFTKEDMAIEVAFNHGGNVSWNLLKPVLSSELNHVEKAIQTRVGVVIAATDKMKKAGGFDGAIGSYEKYVEYLKPLNTPLVTPLMIVGLLAPETFKMVQAKDARGRKIGRCQILETGEIK